MHGSELEIPLRIIGPNGSTVLFQGSGWLGTIKAAICKVVAITANNGLALDPGTFIIQAANLGVSATWGANLLTARPMRTTGSFDRGLLGVAMNAAAIGEQVVIAGADSIVPVSVAGATGTIGHHARPTTVVGEADSNAVALASPQQNLGYVVKPAAATAQPAAADTGSATQMGILVAPH